MQLRNIRSWFEKVFSHTSLSHPEIKKISNAAYTFCKPGTLFPVYRVRHIQTLHEFYAYEAYFQSLSKAYDAKEVQYHPQAFPWFFSSKLMIMLPHLWLVIDQQGNAICASLLIELEDQEAEFASFDNLLIQDELGLILASISAFNYGFETLKLKTIKTKFTPEERDVKSFCTIMGLQKMLNSSSPITYSINSHQYYETLRKD